ARPTGHVLEHAAVAASELCRVTEAEAGPTFARRVGVLEQVRDARRLDARPFVLNAEEAERTVFLHRDADRETARRERDRVQEEVREDLQHGADVAHESMA